MFGCKDIQLTCLVTPVYYIFFTSCHCYGVFMNKVCTSLFFGVDESFNRYTYKVFEKADMADSEETDNMSPFSSALINAISIFNSHSWK